MNTDELKKASEKIWYISIAGDKEGPFTLEELAQRAGAKGLPSKCIAWRKGMGDWLPPSKIPDIQHLSAKKAKIEKQNLEGKTPRSISRKTGVVIAVAAVVAGLSVISIAAYKTYDTIQQLGNSNESLGTAADTIAVKSLSKLYIKSQNNASLDNKLVVENPTPAVEKPSPPKSPVSATSEQSNAVSAPNPPEKKTQTQIDNTASIPENVPEENNLATDVLDDILIVDYPKVITVGEAGLVKLSAKNVSNELLRGTIALSIHNFARFEIRDLSSGAEFYSANSNIMQYDESFKKASTMESQFPLVELYVKEWQPGEEREVSFQLSSPTPLVGVQLMARCTFVHVSKKFELAFNIPENGDIDQQDFPSHSFYIDFSESPDERDGYGIRVDTDNAFKEADGELNRVYKEVISALENTHKEMLKEAQRAWIEYRELCSVTEGNLYEGGSLQGPVTINCSAELTIEQIGLLKSLLPNAVDLGKKNTQTGAESGVLKSADAKMNEVYNAYMKEFDDESVKNAQRAWLKYRDLFAKTVANVYGGEFSEYAETCMLADLTLARTERLKNLFMEGYPEDSEGSGNSTAVASQNDEDFWDGDFSYYETSAAVSGVNDAWEYSFMSRKRGGELHGFLEANGTQLFYKIQCKIVLRPKGIDVVFEKLLDGVANQKQGDILFSLDMAGDHLITTWRELEPMLEQHKIPNVYFVKK